MSSKVKGEWGAAEYKNARNLLTGWLESSSTVYTILRHRSDTGLSRWYDVYVVVDGEIVRITYSVCVVTALRYDRKHDAIRVGGTGFSGADKIVSDLSYCLFDDANILRYREL